LAVDIAKKKIIMPEDVIHGRESQIALRRLGRPEEIAALLTFLASERAGFIAGDSIQIDGGWYKGVMQRLDFL
jgi:3-oxoacyl-[acyl-carrier protein] reductase